MALRGSVPSWGWASAAAASALPCRCAPTDCRVCAIAAKGATSRRRRTMMTRSNGSSAPKGSNRLWFTDIAWRMVGPTASRRWTRGAVGSRTGRAPPNVNKSHRGGRGCLGLHPRLAASRRRGAASGNGTKDKPKLIGCLSHEFAQPTVRPSPHGAWATRETCRPGRYLWDDQLKRFAASRIWSANL